MIKRKEKIRMKRRNKKYILNFIYKSDDDKSAKNLDEMLERLFGQKLNDYKLQFCKQVDIQ